MRRSKFQHVKRRGAVLILAALLMVVLVSMVAFSLDLGYVAVVRTELQRTADSAALAACGNLLDADTLKGSANYSAEMTAGNTAAVLMASQNPAGSTTLSLPTADIVYGVVTSSAYPVNFVANTTTPNAVRVTVRRDATANGALGLFFGGVLGKSTQTVTATATAYFENTVNGFKVTNTTGVNAGVLPFTMKVTDWDAAFTSGTDSYSVNNGSVSNGGDGIREVKLYPLDSSNGRGGGATPGNFGTIDIGNPNNSTADISNQIRNGLSVSDLSYYPNNTFALGSNGSITVTGDTGISAGFKDDLLSIKGKPRVIPLYDQVSGNGNNAQFRLVRFVGCTILEVQLTGSLANKHITIQPTWVIDATAITGGGPAGSANNMIVRPLTLIE